MPIYVVLVNTFVAKYVKSAGGNMCQAVFNSQSTRICNHAGIIKGKLAESISDLIYSQSVELKIIFIFQKII